MWDDFHGEMAGVAIYSDPNKQPVHSPRLSGTWGWKCPLGGESLPPNIKHLPETIVFLVFCRGLTHI